MKSVWKFEILQVNHNAVSMPKGAKLLTVGYQCGQLCVWAEVDPTAPQETRALLVTGTGWDIEDEFVEYIGTAFIEAYVFHVYEVLK